MTAKCDDRIASLKHRIVIETLTRTSDSQGGYAEAWSTEAAVWARIEPLKGYERMQAMQLQTPLTHRITMRYRSGVSTAKRLRYGTRTFDIKEVINEDEANRYLRLTCVETT